jgi:predicted nucleic acid-binding protein
MHLAITDMYRAHWSDDIHAEWIRTAVRLRPDLPPENFHRVRQLMDENVRDCLVTGYQKLIPTLALPDPDDRHVLAAAIRCNAKVIVTFNERDFPNKILAAYGIEAQHPDTFVSNLFVIERAMTLQAAKRHRASLRNPPFSSREYISKLRSQGLPIFASILAEEIGML